MPRRADMNIFTKVPGLAQQTRYVETTVSDTPHTRPRSKMRRRRLCWSLQHKPHPPIRKREKHPKNDRRGKHKCDILALTWRQLAQKREFVIICRGWDDWPWLDSLVMDRVPLFLQQAGVCAPTCLLRVQWEGEWHQSSLTNVVWWHFCTLRRVLPIVCVCVCVQRSSLLN